MSVKIEKPEAGVNCLSCPNCEGTLKVPVTLLEKARAYLYPGVVIRTVSCHLRSHLIQVILG